MNTACKLSAIFISAVFFISCGKIDNKQEPLDKRFKPFIGKTVKLKQVQKADDSIFTPNPGDPVTFINIDTQQISGQISCNGFSADANWLKNGTLLLSNLRQDTSRCPNPVPFTLQLSMAYDADDQGDELYIKDMSGNTATFEKVANSR